MRRRRERGVILDVDADDFGMGELASLAQSVRDSGILVASDELDANGETHTRRDRLNADRAGDVPEAAPVARIAHVILQRALQEGASDIHIRPGAGGTAVYYRIYGILHDIVALPVYVHEPLVRYLQTLAGISVGAGRQRHRAVLHINYRDAEHAVRLSTVRTTAGEYAAMRILYPPSVTGGLDALGMSTDIAAALDLTRDERGGLILVAGPAGSGRTTTLYALLLDLPLADQSVITIEDPVELTLPGVAQAPVDPQEGRDFPTALKQALELDADAIMCSDVPDAATARVLLEASLAAPLVYSAVHADDAVHAMRRLLDLGVSRFMLAEGLGAVLVQRLMRVPCAECAQEREVTPAEREWLRDAGIAEPPPTVSTSQGCEACRKTGVTGRTAAHEVLTIDAELRRLLGSDAAISEVEATAAERLIPLRHDLARKVLAGRVDIVEAMCGTAFLPRYK